MMRCMISCRALWTTRYELLGSLLALVLLTRRHGG